MHLAYSMPHMFLICSWLKLTCFHDTRPWEIQTKLVDSCFTTLTRNTCKVIMKVFMTTLPLNFNSPSLIFMKCSRTHKQCYFSCPKSFYDHSPHTNYIVSSSRQWRVALYQDPWGATSYSSSPPPNSWHDGPKQHRRGEAMIYFLGNTTHLNWLILSLPLSSPWLTPKTMHLLPYHLVVDMVPMCQVPNKSFTSVVSLLHWVAHYSGPCFGSFPMQQSFHFPLL